MGRRFKLYSGPIPSEFRPVPDFPTYYANEAGEIWSTNRNKWRRISTRISRTGYEAGFMMVDNVRINIRVHQIICATFHGPRNGRVVNHKDSIRHNNNADNLEWKTQSENCLHASAKGRLWDRSGAKNHQAKLTREQVLEIAVRADAGENTKTIADDYGVNRTRVQLIKRREHWVFKCQDD